MLWAANARVKPIVLPAVIVAVANIARLVVAVVCVLLAHLPKSLYTKHLSVKIAVNVRLSQRLVQGVAAIAAVMAFAGSTEDSITTLHMCMFSIFLFIIITPFRHGF
jgi:hypothetical protein